MTAILQSSIVETIKVFKSKWFNKWADKNSLADNELLKSIENLKQNKGTVKLGANLYKVRIATQHAGKSGGYRTIVVHILGVRSIFVYGFSKNERDNISSSDLEDYRELAKTYTQMQDGEIELLLENSLMFKVEEKKYGK